MRFHLPSNCQIWAHVQHRRLMRKVFFFFFLNKIGLDMGLLGRVGEKMEKGKSAHYLNLPGIYRYGYHTRNCRGVVKHQIDKVDKVIWNSCFKQRCL